MPNAAGHGSTVNGGEAMSLCETLNELLNERRLEAAKAMLNSTTPEEIVQCLRDFDPRTRVLLFRLLQKQRALEVFEQLDRGEQSQLVRGMEDPDLVRLIEAISPEERVQLLEELPAKVVKRVLQELSPEARASIQLLLGYPEDSAGRAMNPDYLALPEKTTAAAALERVHQSTLTPEHLEVVFVLGEGRTYKGYVTLARLLKAPPETPICDLVEGEAVAVPATDPQEKVADLFKRRQYPLVAVVDSEGRLIGAIDAERGLQLVEELEAQRLTTFGGTLAMSGPDIDLVSTPLRRVFTARVFWLIVLTVFGVLTSTFVAQQEEILSAAIVLAAFIAPIIDMGGNTGSQAATLVIRAMALGRVHLRLRDFLLVLKRDIPVALAMGVTIGILEAILAFVSKGVGADILLVVGLAMLAVTISGSLIGLGLPFIARKLGFDPATLAGPTITSIMDLLGVMIYFGLAYVFLGHLLKQ
ncbi:MAG: magnesium transporter [Thermoflexales bacterium]|nr:magnesium transporter [Thermoflexales bacterium]